MTREEAQLECEFLTIVSGGLPACIIDLGEGKFAAVYESELQPGQEVSMLISIS